MKSNIQILPAKHGDAFILDLWTGDKHGVVVVDSGPSNAGRSIYMKYFDLPSIDLMVITHFDDDHIAGIKKYTEYVCDKNIEWNIKEMWVNNSKNYPITLSNELSLGQATKLSNALEIIKMQHKEFEWEPYISEGYCKDFRFAKIEVVSPPLDYEQYMISCLKEERFELSDNINSDIVDPMDISLEDLAKNEDHTPNLDNYDELANATSIAFILECVDFRILMLGDSYPQNVEKYLRRKYSEENKLQVDYVKVSHHGSLVNSSTSLYGIIDCKNYIISTNGNRYNHPDREAIAKIVCCPNRTDEIINIFLNYPKENFSEGSKRFINEGEEEKYKFKMYYQINSLPLCK